MTGRVASVALLCLAAGAAGCGSGKGLPGEKRDAPERRPAGVAAAPARPSVPLRGCWMTVHLFQTPAARLDGLVAAGYRFGDYFSPTEATLAIWVLACDRMGARRGVLSLAGVQVAPPVRGYGATSGPAGFHHYLLGADTDSPELRSALRAAGQPVRLVPGLDFRRAGGGATAVNPAARGGFAVSIRASKLDRPHEHRNAFWFGTGARRTGFELRFPRANDRYCFGGRDGCTATATAPPGSRLWKLLGSRTPARATTAFDHLEIATGTLELQAIRRAR